MKRAIPTALLLLLVTAPVEGGPPRPDRAVSLAEARAEVAAIERLAIEVRSPDLRRRLHDRSERALAALDDAAAAGRHAGYDGHDGHDGYNGYNGYDSAGGHAGHGGHAGQGSGYLVDDSWHHESVSPWGLGRAGLSYAEAAALVRAESFDSSRVETIERLARTSRFTSAEAGRLAGLCTFDSSRSEALIALYPAVTDPGRFEIALSALAFDGSRAQVAEALSM